MAQYRVQALRFSGAAVFTRKPGQKQGRIHDSISRVRVIRGSNAVKLAFQQKFQQRDQLTDGPMDGRTDGPTE